MAKIDLYDPKWVDMVFAGKNKEYGAYQLRKGTSGRNIKALLILVIAAALVGGFLAWKVIEQKQAEEQQAYMEAMELAKLQQQAKKEEKKKEPVKPKIEPKKEIPVARETQKFTAPVIKKDELVKEENQVKQMDKLDEKVAVGTENKEGVKDRTIEAVRSDIATVAPPPPPAPNPEVSTKVFDVVESLVCREERDACYIHSFLYLCLTGKTCFQLVFTFDSVDCCAGSAESVSATASSL